MNERTDFCIVCLVIVMRMFLILLYSFFACQLLAACAYTTAGPVIEGDERGFVYPTCYPFLVVSGAKADLVMVPNPNKQRAIRFGAFLAKNDIDITFEQCGPSNIKTKLDSTDTIIALFTTLQEAAKAGTSLGNLFGAKEAGGNPGHSFQVFEFVFDHDGTFNSLKPLVRPGDFVRVHVSSAPQAKKNLGSSKDKQKKSDDAGKAKDPLKK